MADDGMTDTTVFIYEKRPRWTPGLQHLFSEGEVRVRGVGKLSRELLNSDDGGHRVLLLVLADAEAACLQFLGTVSASLMTMPVIVIGDSSTMELEWAVRDLGASHFVNELTPLHDVARICRRFADSSNE